MPPRPALFSAAVHATRGPTPDQLFPLPHPELLFRDVIDSGHDFSCRQSYDLGFNAARGLNQLSGFCDFSREPPNSQQLEVAARIVSLASGRETCRDAPRGSEALKSVLKGGSGYEDSLAASQPLRSFNLGKVSLPSTEDVQDCPHIKELLPDSCRPYLEDHYERMLRPSRDFAEKVERNPITPYWDPVLKRNHRQYTRFIKKLQKLDMLHFTLSPIEFAAIFFQSRQCPTNPSVTLA